MVGLQYKNKRESPSKERWSQMTTLTLNNKIAIAAEMVANGELVSFRGASADTYQKVMALANRIKQDREFPQCPCEECL